MKKQIIDFILYLKVERAYADNTCKAYEKDLFRLFEYLREQGISTWSQLNSENLNLYMMHLRHGAMNSRSIRRHLSSVRGFLSYLLSQRLVESNVALGLQTPKIDQTLPKTLDYEKIMQMLKLNSSSVSELRDVAILEVIYSCGLRVSELVGLDTKDIDHVQGFLKVMGKGAKMRHTPLGDSAKSAIDRYTKKANINQGALFLNKYGKRIGIRSVQAMVKKRALAVGIEVNVHPHMLRHAAATHFLQSSHDLRSVQEFLGHQSIKSTQVYTHLDFLELSKVYDKHHPRAKKS